MTRWESVDQAAAFVALYRETGAVAAFTSDVAQHAVRVTLWGAESDTPVCMGTISVAGTVRTDLMVTR